jgi:hypothetical protein
VFFKKYALSFFKAISRWPYKIALTAIISFYLCAELDFYVKHPETVIGGLWCVIASIIVFQPNLGGTYKAIWNRFLGVLMDPS